MNLPLSDRQRARAAQHLEVLASWVLRPARLPALVRSWDEADWDLFALLAYWQGVLALLAAGPLFEQLPPSMQDTVQTARTLNRRRNERLLEEMAAMLDALSRAGIPGMPLKGSVLLECELYEDLGLRSLRDLDLLVPAQQFEPALAVLHQLGYQSINRTKRHVILAPSGGGEVVTWRFDHPDNPRRVDLHADLVETFRGTSYDLTAWLWKEARPRAFLGSQVPVPSLPALMHHAVVHASSNILDRSLRLIHLVDLDMLAGRLSPCEQQTALAPLPGADARFLYPSLRLVTTYAPSGPLEAACERLGSQVHPALRNWSAQGRLSNRTFVIPEARPIGETLRFWPRSRREQLAVLRHTLFHNRYELAGLYPRLAASPFFWLCYPRFWVSLLRSWGKRGRWMLGTRSAEHGS